MPWLIRPPDLPIYGFRKTSSVDKIGNSGSVNTSRRSFTIACWMRRTGSLGAFETLLASNTAEYIELYINSATNDHLLVYSDSVGTVDTGFSVPASERWFYVAMTLSASAQTGYLTYSPGKWDVTGSQGPATGSGAVNSAFYFGGDIDGQAPPGDVACLRAWSRPLSSQELLTEMMSPNAASLQGLLFDVKDYSRANSASVPLQITHGAGGNSVKVSNKPLILPSLELPYFVGSGAATNPITAFEGFQSDAFQGPAGYLQNLLRTAFQQNAFQDNAFQIYGSNVASGSDTNINAQNRALTLTAFNATITVDRNVLATSRALTLTAFAATITRAQNVSATSRALTLTANAATITLDRNVLAASRALTLVANAATVTIDRNVNAASRALTLTAFAATISTTADVDVSVSLATLSLTAYPATITLISDAGPAAALDSGHGHGGFELPDDDNEMEMFRQFLEKVA